MSTAISITKPLATSMIRSGTIHTAVGVAAAAMPQYAPVIYGAYTAFRLGWSAIRAYREYKELRAEMSSQRAKRVELERTTIREGVERITASLDADFEQRVGTHVAVLMARPEIQDTMNAVLRKEPSDEAKQRFAMMMQVTATQFLVGAAQGGKGHLIDKSADLFFR